jgi:hypothetical protein
LDFCYWLKYNARKTGQQAAGHFTCQSSAAKPDVNNEMVSLVFLAAPGRPLNNELCNGKR